jgi:hypothetical protein
MRNLLLYTLMLTATMAFGQGGIDKDPDSDVGGRNINKDYNPIETAVPFLTIAPDSRAGAMGDIGVATSPDAYSQHWNPAKYAFMKSNVGGGFSYVPWLNSLDAGITLTNLSGFYRFAEDQTISSSLQYFNLGSIKLTQDGDNFEEIVPNEFSFDAAYTRLFGEQISAAIAMRYIYSGIFRQLTSQDNPYKAGTSIAADIAMYYQNDITVNEYESELALGLHISNIGNKLSYQENGDKLYIPTNLRIGGRLTTSIDEYNKITIATDINKLLVPSSNKDLSPIEGIFVSFTDGSFGEEMSEIMLSVGAEYWYQNQFALRAGLFREHEQKGNRKFFTLGAGFKLNIIGIDISYLVPYGTSNSPLEGTMRFSVSVNMDGQ